VPFSEEDTAPLSAQAVKKDEVIKQARSNSAAVIFFKQRCIFHSFFGIGI
jgi:hypothetical protein